MIVERDEDGVFVATVPELPGCATQADSEPELLERIKEAIALYLDVKGEPADRNEFVGVRRVEVES